MVLLSVFVLSFASSGAPRLLPSFLQHCASALLRHYCPRPQTRPAESCRGPGDSLDRSNDPEGTHYIYLSIFPASVFVSQTTCSNKMHVVITQALHLIGQALLEEKTQLEDSTVEEVTFDFSVKARSK